MIGDIKVDTRSLDYSPFALISIPHPYIKYSIAVCYTILGKFNIKRGGGVRHLGRGSPGRLGLEFKVCWAYTRIIQSP